MTSEPLRLEAGEARWEVRASDQRVHAALARLYHGYQTGGADWSDSQLLAIEPTGVVDQFRLRGPDLDTTVDHWAAAVDQGDVALAYGLLAGFPGMLHFHAGAAAGPGGAVLMPAASGSGKSTLTAYLCRIGWPTYGDDIVLWEPESARLHPFRRLPKLHRDVWPVVGLGPDDAGVGDTWSEIARPEPAEFGAGWAAPAVVRMIVFPRFVAGASLTVRARPGGEAILRLLTQMFSARARTGPAIATIAALVTEAEVVDIEYGRVEDVADELAHRFAR